MQTRWMNPIGLAGAFTLAALVVSAPQSAQAQAQDDSVEQSTILNLEQRVWGTIVRGMGLRDPNAPEIDYRERSPLVVPPTRDLPPPQARATPRDPAWPNDPDLAKTRKANETKRVRNGGGNAATAIESRGAPISPSELNRGTTGSTQTAGDPNRSNAPASGAEGRPVAPSELGYFGGLFSGRAWGFGGYQEETGTFSSEPPRTALTEPPVGYQTPSGAQPYGVTRRVERTGTEQFDPAGRDYQR